MSTYETRSTRPKAKEIDLHQFLQDPTGHLTRAGEGVRLIVEVDGRPVAALVSLKDLAALRDSSEVFSKVALAAALNSGLAHALADGLRAGPLEVVVDGSRHLLPAPQVTLEDPQPLFAMEAQNSFYSTRRRSKYARLTDHLEGVRGDDLALPFDEIERILGSPLPSSAHRYSAWWTGNPGASPTHAQKQAWGAAGFYVESVDLAGGVALFRRGSPATAG
jgi:hypothetical protein